MNRIGGKNAILNRFLKSCWLPNCRIHPLLLKCGNYCNCLRTNIVIFSTMKNQKRPLFGFLFLDVLSIYVHINTIRKKGHIFRSGPVKWMKCYCLTQNLNLKNTSIFLTLNQYQQFFALRNAQTSVDKNF